MKFYVVLFLEAMSEALHKGCEHISFYASIIYVSLCISMHNLWSSCYCSRSLKDNAKITSARVKCREAGVVRNFPTWQGHFFYFLNYCHCLDATKGLWQPGVCLLTEAEASMWIRLTVWIFFFFYTVFVPEGMCCNYLHSPYLFSFNWNTEIVLKLSFSNGSGLSLLFFRCLYDKWVD